MISLSKRKDNDHFGENLFRLCYLYNLLLDGLICQTWTLNLTFNITLKTVASSCFSEYVHMFVLIVNLGPVGPFATSMRRKLKKKNHASASKAIQRSFYNLHSAAENEKQYMECDWTFTWLYLWAHCCHLLLQWRGCCTHSVGWMLEVH